MVAKHFKYEKVPEHLGQGQLVGDFDLGELGAVSLSLVCEDTTPRKKAESAPVAPRSRAARAASPSYAATVVPQQGEQPVYAATVVPQQQQTISSDDPARRATGLLSYRAFCVEIKFRAPTRRGL